MTKEKSHVASDAAANSSFSPRLRVSAPSALDSPTLYRPEFEHDNCGVGFIAQIKGEKSHQIVRDALHMLTRMDHRGACGCETNTGDGAGILTALPTRFLREAAQRDAGIDLPDPGRGGVFAAGNLFLPQDEADRDACIRLIEGRITHYGQTLLGWRDLPQDPDAADIGPTARKAEPVMRQLFIGPGANIQAVDGSLDREAFERKLYLIRKSSSHAIHQDETIEQRSMFYACSLSTRVLIYKGQLTSTQVAPYFPDLRDERYVSHLAMVHSRFSTNTFPSWDRAQPLRWMSHNGEINTVKGNQNWLAARQGVMQSERFGDELKELFPIVEAEMSDSGTFDNCLELLLLSGRSLPEAVMMMIPEAWENHDGMSDDKKAFYEYHANLMEPWDGPASISFTDGKQIGAVLDRNGLRPSRYYVTTDDRVILASEVGVLDLDPAVIRIKGRLEPGRMFLVDFEQGRIIPDAEVKYEVAGRRPYKLWLKQHRLRVADFGGDESDEGGPFAASPPPPREPLAEDTLPLLQAFGYTQEHLSMLLLPMVKTSKEALGSMGNDAALACLSDQPRLLYDYFKQLFAQVTNPPIDPIREEVIMSLKTRIGPEGNLLATTPGQARRLYLPQPILLDDQLAGIRENRGLADEAQDGWTARTIDCTYQKPAANADASSNGNGHASARPQPADHAAAMTAALDRICDEASRAIADGVPLLILSDRNVAKDRIPLPTLLASGSVHQHLIRQQSRTQIGLIVETGEAREVHHFCLLFGYGADAVNPYLAFRSLELMQQQGILEESMLREKVQGNYITAIGKGVLKVMSKMGISTLASYKGAQIFEAVGLREEVIDRAFTGTASRLKGVGFEVLAIEAARRHELGFPPRVQRQIPQLPNPGEYHWRPQGEQHAFSPQTISSLQVAARTNSRGAYEQYAKTINEGNRTRCTLRGLIGFRGENSENPSISLDEVEPAGEIVKRFRTGAMSLGSLSQEAHETLAEAMNRIGGMSNSGEGGEDPARFPILNNPDGSVSSKRSAIKQVASGRFGVTSFYLVNADTLQIKIAQGAKPGEGGQLPGHKVSEYIGSIRYSTPGVGLISPPPHHDIYSIEDLAQLIFDLKNANPEANVSVKLVAEVGVGTVAAGVAKAHADHILISGHDGGTGASPLTSIKHAGLPWELGLAETHQTLVLNDLRSRVRLETDGGFKTGRDVVIAACLGAEEFGFSTAPLITVGCIMMRKCHLNTCPVGVCTQDPVLRKKFNGQPEHVINFLFMVAEEARQLMAKLGVRTVDELIGRTDLLDADDAIRHWKADGLDLSPILAPAQVPAGKHADDVGRRKLVMQDHALEHVMDQQLIKDAAPALEHGEEVEINRPITNLDRAVGTMLSSRVSRLHGRDGLPDGTIRLHLKGSAGQSLGAFLARGITIDLEGDANDYVGKGLSGGKIVVYPPQNGSLEGDDNIIAGNVCLYGATAGECYLRGVVAERFGVRNSGVLAVVEGVGDHGCEYMTGGRVVILGKTGRNFAAGMSGGIAYILDEAGTFESRCNLGMVDLEALDQIDDINEVKDLVRRHLEYTGSPEAARVLRDFDTLRESFVKVMPIDYRKVLILQKQQTRRLQQEDAPEVGLG